jgi:hypothetical protein
VFLPESTNHALFAHKRLNESFNQGEALSIARAASFNGLKIHLELTK